MQKPHIYWPRKENKGMPEKYRVTKNYKSPHPDPIVFQKGEQVEIGDEYKGDPDWGNWIWCKGKDKKQAWVPLQYLEVKAGAGIFKTSYNALELSVLKGEELVVHEKINGFGMAEKTNGKKGWVPLRNMIKENG